MNFILNLFSAGIQNRKITLPSDEELKNQMRIISEQTFLPYLYKVSNDARFKKYYLSSFVLHEKYDEIAEKIADIFSANQIRYFFFKGYELFPLYEDRNLRLSGDIDFCVDGKDYLKARKLLEENSFVLDSIAKHHAEYVYDKSYAELHHQLLLIYQRHLFLERPYDPLLLFHLMILQYSNGITECYEEAQSISVGEIEVKKEWRPADVINGINSRIKGVWGEQTFEFRTDQIISENSKTAKFAIINIERTKEKVLVFNDSTTLYLLNDKGKTLKIF